MITFEPLWKTLKDKNISQYDLIEHYHMSRGTLDNLKHNRSITLNTLNDLCNKLPISLNTPWMRKKKVIDYKHFLFLYFLRRLSAVYPSHYLLQYKYLN